MTPLGGARRSSWAPPPPDGTGRPMATVSPQLRASRGDRQRCADYLTAAYAVEQLDNDELSARLDAALKATTLGDLDALTADLNVDTMQALVPAETRRKALAAARQRARKRGRPATVVVAVVAAVALVVTGGILVFNRTTADAPPAPAGQPAGNAPGDAVPNAAQLTWAHTIGEVGANSFEGVAVAPDGTRIAAGYSDNAPNPGPLHPDPHRDAVIAAYAPDGTLSWSKTLGGSGTDEFTSVAVAPDGTILAAGSTTSTDGDFPTTALDRGASDGVVVALSPDGALLWSRTYGGDNWDSFAGIALAPDGNIIVAGSTSSTDGDFPSTHENPDTPDNDAIAASLRLDGTLAWGRSYGGSGWDSFDAVTVATSGDILVAGSTTSTDGDFPYDPGDLSSHRAVLAAVSPAGTLRWHLWHASFLGFRAVAVAADGTLVAAGAALGGSDVCSPAAAGGTAGCAALAAYSQSGSPLWVHGWGGAGDSSFEALAIDDGTIVAGGSTTASSGDFASGHAGTRDALLARVSADGTLLSSGTWGGDGDDALHAVVRDTSGHVVGVGATSSVLDSDTWSVKLDSTAVVGDLTLS